MFPCLVLAQTGGPIIGIIDFYGRQKVPEAAIRKALGFQEGDPLPRSKGDVEDAIEQVPGVVRAHLEATCCEDAKAILYIGIEEKGAPHFDYNPAPAGAALLPREIHDEYVHFLAVVGLAVRAGQTKEDLRQGHSLMEHEGVREHQLRFVELAKAHLARLREVLANSFDEEHRAIAAYVIGYAPDKAAIVDDLTRALRDPDDTVRNNALRSLSAIAILAMREPEREIKIAPTWFVEMLHSLIWSDRSAAAVALVNLTEKRDPQVLALLRERALTSLGEMAQWRHLPHALPAFILIGRMAGVEEQEIQNRWAGEDRAVFVGQTLEALRKGAGKGAPRPRRRD